MEEGGGRIGTKGRTSFYLDAGKKKQLGEEERTTTKRRQRQEG